MRRDRRVGRRVVLAQEFQRALGEHHAEAEGGVGRVLLENADFGAAVAALDQVAELEPGRPGAEDGDAHAPKYYRPGLRTKLRSFPRKRESSVFRVGAGRSWDPACAGTSGMVGAACRARLAAMIITAL